MNKKIKVFEAFSGIGSPRMALIKNNIDFEVVGISEIDKYAIKSYNAIYDETNDINYGDISKINARDIPNHDLFVYGFPCQDVSLAGKQEGLEKNSGTRSSLLWACEDVIKNKKPKYLIMENVKNLASKKFKPYFENWLEVLSDLGYTNYWKILNTKNFGIPQNRERVFCISILGEHAPFEFPEPKELKLRLKDLLEKEVDEKFYLSQKQIDRIKASTYNSNNRRIQEKEWCDTLCARDYKDPKCVRVEDKIIYEQRTDEGLRFLKDNVCSSIRTSSSGECVITNKRIRKLTPREHWRLQGFPDWAFDKAQKVNSNSQLYKQAGNAITVDVLEKIFEKIFYKFGRN